MIPTTLRFSALLAVLSTTVAGCSGDDTAGPLPLSGDGGDAAADGSTQGHDGSADGQSSPDASQDAPAPSDSGTDATLDAGGDGAAPEDASDAADAFDATPPPAQVRVAWLDDPAYVPALGGSRFDFCIAPHGTGAWVGPMVAGAGGAGLGLGDVTAYFDVAPAQYDVRIVSVEGDAGAPSCTPALLDAGVSDASSGDGAADGGSEAGAPPITDFTDLPTLSSSSAFTFVFTPPFTSSAPGSVADVLPLIDEATTTAGKVGVRFANVAGPAGASGLDYGSGGGATFAPWFTGVTSSQHLAPSADTNGYIEVDPFTQLDTSLEQGGTELGVSDGFDAPAGARISAFAALVAQAGGGVAPGLVACADGATRTGAPWLSDCNPISVVPPGTVTGVLTRFGDFVADPGFEAVDVCLKYDTAPAWTGKPLLGASAADGGTPGLVGGQVSPRFPLHEGFTYDVRLVAAGATDCTKAVTLDGKFLLLSSSSNLATVAMAGYQAPPEDGGLPPADAGLTDIFVAAVLFEDLACPETAPVVRAIHLATATPQDLDFTLQGSSGWTFPAVPYGDFITSIPRDGCGYMVVATESGATLDVGGVTSTYSVTATTEQTLYAFTSLGQIKVLACDDGKTGACSVLP